jgi:hypothetical protein
LIKQPKNSFNHLELKLNEDTHLFLSIQQMNPRLMQKPFKNTPASPSRIIIGQVVEERESGERKFEFIDACYSYEGTLIWDSKTPMSMGLYVVFIEVDWVQQ